MGGHRVASRPPCLTPAHLSRSAMARALPISDTSSLSMNSLQEDQEEEAPLSRCCALVPAPALEFGGAALPAVRACLPPPAPLHIHVLLRNRGQ